MLKKEWEIKLGALDGASKTYYKTGEVMCEEYFINGKKTGKSTTFNKNGNIATVDNYMDGARIKRIVYDKSMQIK